MNSVRPKKKRVRRQKLELEYLRDLARKLENRMEQLQVTDTNVESLSIWRPIAERQLKDRRRAEEKNQKLRDSVEEQLKLVARMEKLLHRRLRNKDVVAEAELVKAVSGGRADGDVFADQLAHVERAHLEATALFSGTAFGASAFNGVRIIEDASSDTGVAFITRSNTILPFDTQVTEKGFWRAFAQEGASKTRYFYDQRVLTETVMANSYGLLFRAGRFYGDVWGKQTYRRYAVDGNILIMWKSMVEPAEINDAKFYGLRCHQTGWIKISGVKLSDANAGPLASTALQSYTKMTVELREGIADQDVQVGALADFVIDSYETITKVYGEMINDVLVEEDWNLNGWYPT